MIFKELETKQKFDNNYGKCVWIDRYVHFPGTEQISIYIKSGYGAGERVINKVISEHELEQWILDFRGEFMRKIPEQKTNILPNNEKMETKNNFSEMRQLLFNAMNGLKDGSVQLETAKGIGQIAQVVINSVKVEVDFLKLTENRKELKSIE